MKTSTHEKFVRQLREPVVQYEKKMRKITSTRRKESKRLNVEEINIEDLLKKAGVDESDFKQ